MIPIHHGASTRSAQAAQQTCNHTAAATQPIGATIYSAVPCIANCASRQTHSFDTYRKMHVFGGSRLPAKVCRHESSKSTSIRESHGHDWITRTVPSHQKRSCTEKIVVRQFKSPAYWHEVPIYARMPWVKVARWLDLSAASPPIDYVRPREPILPLSILMEFYSP